MSNNPSHSMIEFKQNAATTNTGNYQMRPPSDERLKLDAIKNLMQNTMRQILKDRNYNTDEAGQWAKEVSDSVSAAVKDLNGPRYRHVVQAAIGQHLGQGFHYMGLCFWDAETDGHTTSVFSNATLYCVCNFFGIYDY